MSCSRSLLDFLAIILSKSETGDAVIQDLSFSYVETVVTFLASPNSHFTQRKFLFNSLMVCLCACQRSAEFVNTKRITEKVWTLSFGVVRGPGRLAATGDYFPLCRPHAILESQAFARYVLMTALPNDCIKCLEIWNLLLSSLSAILSSEISTQEGPLALLGCPTLCGALCKLVSSSDPYMRERLCLGRTQQLMLLARPDYTGFSMGDECRNGTSRHTERL